MAIQYNENIKIAAPLPLDSRYLSLRTSGGNPLPYSSTTEVNNTIISSERYVGLTVLINTGTTDTEYWYKNGITNGSLIEKKYDTIVPFSDYITGGTNLGFFSGKTGIQTLQITNDGDPYNQYTGPYQSLYNWYYRGIDGKIHTGAPSDGIERRGYLKPPTTVPPNPYYKSWVWNDYIGGGSLKGWILVDGNVALQIGLTPTVGLYYPPSTPYTATTWITGYHNNGSDVTISASGSLTTGTTLTIGGPPYAFKDHNNLHFRTLISDTPDNIKVSFDESFVHVSGITSVLNGQNVGTGVGQVFKQRTGTTMQFRTIEGTGDTAIYQVGDRILISATGSVSGTTQATNVGTGIGIFKSKTGNTLQFRTLVGSGGTCITQVGDEVIIQSTDGTYNLASPSVIPLGGICSGTVLTGKTAFELFEELLVPELCGSITPPSIGIGLTASGLYEIGCTLSQTVTGTFSRGSISPQYCSASAFRSGCAISYDFTGCGMPSGFQACTAASASNINASYTVIIGTQSWGVCTCYDSGNTAQGSKGTVYSAALPAGCTSPASASIVGVYPLFGTTSSISTLTAQALQNMSTANDIQITLQPETGGYKQKFEIPCAWLGAPISRPLVGVCQWNTVSSQWEYPGGSAPNSLTIWTCTPASETVQGSSIGYCQFTYNGACRAVTTCIRLVF